MTCTYPQYLVETAWLEAHLNDPDLRILDCTVLFSTAVYLSPAANSAGPVWGRSHAVNRTVMTSQTGLTRRTSGHFPCP